MEYWNNEKSEPCLATVGNKGEKLNLEFSVFTLITPLRHHSITLFPTRDVQRTAVDMVIGNRLELHTTKGGKR